MTDRSQHNPEDLTPRFAQLSEARQRLIRAMQQARFGSITGLVIRAGEPVMHPEPRIIRQIKLGAEPTADHCELKDFALKLEHVQLLDAFASVQNGTIDTIQFRHGLPVLIETGHAAT